MTNPNDPAFARTHPSEQCASDYTNGLTKREWFAGMAMMGLSSADASWELTQIAEWAVSQADVLIDALNKPTTGEAK